MQSIAKKRKSSPILRDDDTDNKRLKTLLHNEDKTFVHRRSVQYLSQETLHFDKLPVEIQLKIFSYLRPKHLITASLVSYYWSQLATDDFLWRSLCIHKARFVPWSDGIVRKPACVHSWVKFYPTVKLQNEIKRLGVELLDHVFLTCDFEWQIVSFCLSERSGILLPHYKLVVGPEPANKHKQFNPVTELNLHAPPQYLTEEEFVMSLNILGVQQQLRSSFFGQIFTDLYNLLQEHEIQWAGHLVTLRHSKNSCSMSDMVELIFSNRVRADGTLLKGNLKKKPQLHPTPSSVINNQSASNLSQSTQHSTGPANKEEDDDENWTDSEVYKIPLSPIYSMINPQLLSKVLQRASCVEEHDKKLRAILMRKKFTSTDLENSIVRLVDFMDHQDPNPILIPFQVIGSFSKEYCTWCWSWYNESYTAEQCQTISRLRNTSKREKWPEMNLFNTPVIDCEAVFAFAIAHLTVARMDNPYILVYPFSPLEDGPRIFLALDVPPSLLDMPAVPRG